MVKLKSEKQHMPSPAQYAANRLNAEKSHGPTSPQGRARSKMNALRHGLTARVVVLPTEDMAAYQTFSKEIVDSLDAQTPVERQFAQTEIHSAMTAARAFRDDSKSFVNLSIYEQRLTGPLYGGLSAAPVDEGVSAPAQRTPNRAPRADPPAIGVVHASARRDLLQDSLLAEKAGFNLAAYRHMQPRESGADDLVVGGVLSEDLNQPTRSW
jgi:hypothetical protein